MANDYTSISITLIYMDFLANARHLYSQESHENFFVGWPVKPAFEIVQKHFENTETVFATEGDEVIGFISAFTDEALFAFIPLLEVREDFQGKGIGSQLVARMRTHFGPLYAIDLACDPELAPFYEKAGFFPGTAMHLRNRNAL